MSMITMNDSGHRTDYGNGAKRERAEGKGRYDLIPPEALKAAALVFEAGAKKYGDRNWENGIPKDTCIDSALRHITQAQMGDTDEDHMAHALTNIMMYLALRDREIDDDDCGCEAEFDSVDESAKSGYLYVAPLGTDPLEWPRGWVELGCTDEGFSESLSFPRETSVSFKMDEVSVENFQKAFNQTYPTSTPNVRVSEHVASCCVNGTYSRGKQHSIDCNVESVKRVADKHARVQICNINACPNVGHPLEEDGCPIDHAR